MQGSESGESQRYVIKSLDDLSWSIADTETGRAYLLGLTRLGNFRVHLHLVEISKIPRSNAFLSYLQEIMSCCLELTDERTGPSMLRWIVRELEDGAEVSNPIDIAIRLGADLHGQHVKWPNPTEIH